jgi:hypothetical protein
MRRSGPFVTRETYPGNVTLYTRRVTTWSDVLSELSYFGPGYIFRGQRRDWPLKCSLHRLRGDHDVAGGEARSLLDFQRRAHLFLTGASLPERGEDLEWLALLQHHGGPTRLLDFSQSAYVAAFNALDEHEQVPDKHEQVPDEPSPCVMWALNKWDVAKRCVSAMRAALPDKLSWLSEHTLLVKPIESCFLPLRPPAPFVGPLRPFRLNARMVAQQGLFLCLGDPGRSVFENFEHDGVGDSHPIQAVKLVFPRTDRRAMLAALREMNIGRDTLFPGLDGLAQSFWHTLLPHTTIHTDALLRLISRPSNWPDASPSSD